MYNAEITSARSTIQGGVEALRFQRKPNELDLRDTSVNGIKNFEATGCSGGSGNDAVPAAPVADAPVDPRQFLKNLPKGVSRVTIPSPPCFSIRARTNDAKSPSLACSAASEMMAPQE